MFNTEFLITSLVVVLIPGTGVIYTVVTKSKLSKFKTFRTEFIQPPERDIVHLITTRKL